MSGHVFVHVQDGDASRKGPRLSWSFMAAIAEITGVVTSSPVALQLSARILAKAGRVVEKLEGSLAARAALEGHMGDADLRRMVLESFHTGGLPTRVVLLPPAHADVAVQFGDVMLEAGAVVGGGVSLLDGLKHVLPHVDNLVTCVKLHQPYVWLKLTGRGVLSTGAADMSVYGTSTADAFCMVQEARPQSPDSVQ